MSETNYDISSHVIQNAKDIKDLQINERCFNAMDELTNKRIDNVNKRLNSHRIAGICNSISIMLLGCIAWAFTKDISGIAKRIKEIEDDKVINVEE